MLGIMKTISPASTGPDFIAGRLMKGETIRIESLGYYYLEEGKIARILGARFKTLD